MQEMDAKVQEVLSIKYEDMPDMRDRFSINASRCVKLASQIINDRADKKLIKMRKNAFKGFIEYKA